METASSPTVLPNSTQQRSAKYTITLQGSQWDVAYYGIVEFLRAHPSGRIIVGIVGALSLVLLAASLLVTIPGLPKGAWFWLLFITPAVLWTATVSGPLFELTFPAAKASAEREFAEKQFDKSQTPEDALNLDLMRLREYYTINQSQARSSFRWAKFAMLVGFATIIAGIWLFYFHVLQPDRIMSSVAAATGCVIDLVSGLYLWLNSQTQNRALRYYEPLVKLQRLSLAIRLAEALKDTSEQTLARNMIIRELLASSRK